MHILMISLDKKILDPNSTVAQRMVAYGTENELFILIPDAQKREVQLSPTVHAFSTGGNKFQQYLRLKKQGLQLIQKHTIQQMTVQDPSFLGNIGRWLKKKTGIALEVQIHGDFFGSDFYTRHLKDRIGYGYFGKKNVRVADRVRVVGERVKASVVALGVDARKIIVQPVALSASQAQSVQVRQLFPGHDTYFLFVGRLEEVKNILWLLDVFAEVVHTHKKNAFLLMLGDGSQKQPLQTMIEERQLNNHVVLQGFVPAVAYYQSVDAVLFPSLSEGYGLVPMEANAAGTPVIMNNVGVANFELKPSEKVKIIPVFDRDAWIKAILSI